MVWEIAEPMVPELLVQMTLGRIAVMIEGLQEPKDLGKATAANRETVIADRHPTST
jgi:hypothetical protein